MRADAPAAGRADTLHDERQLWVERQRGIPGCDRCDEEGYLPDDERCWHGKEPLQPSEGVR
ncbi:hypothetical protein A5711_21600 [Mycobacterium sp. E2238]|nr:hypothetical protein A5711_21600 [Mycobacterium sp. E2238]